MFSHFLAGELIFLFVGQALGLHISQTFLIFGAFCGISPDLLSYFLNRRIHYDKWYHSHRDNFSHSLFFPLLVFIAIAFWIGWQMALLVSLAILSHPLLDLYGIGWGVKLFLPVSDDIYKLFYKKKGLYVFEDDKERDRAIDKHQVNDWFRQSYFTLKKSLFAPWWWSIFEWWSLAVAILLPLSFFLYK